ncbi:endonuclease [Tenacibaculum mesophilum]|uniref:endonuclease n=1 Tax=Tenacibaculum mesophilum TaxID=104268 RepID=UPI000B0E4095|nr:endonuclease [Tenacibaculum mesophilum]
MKKIIGIITILMLFINCGGSDSDVVPTEDKVVAVDDSFEAEENKENVLASFLENDTYTSGNVKVTFETSSARNGTIVKSNNAFIYTPAQDFVGTDSFKYTICSTITPSNCSTAIVTISVKEDTSGSEGNSGSFTIPSEVADYYKNVDFTLTGSSLKDALTTLTTNSHTTKLNYTNRHNYLYNADEDLNNNANVILMYSGESRDEREYSSNSNNHPTQTFNTEHVYPKSLLSNSIAEADLHHLRSCDININSNRGNLPFIDGTGTYKKDNNAWFPGDDWKGDVARMVFYLHTRYGSSFDKVGSLNLFLKWNKDDPVSDFEKQRNNVIANAQGNRNPFIDNPYLATVIWNGDAAENTWE